MQTDTNSQAWNVEGLKKVLEEQGLTKRQAEISAMVACGASNQDIADSLFISEKAVRSHLSDTYKKLKVKSRAQLIVRCLPHTFYPTEVA